MNAGLASQPAREVADEEKRRRRHDVHPGADNERRPAADAGIAQQQRARGEAGRERGDIEADDAAAVGVAR